MSLNSFFPEQFDQLKSFLNSTNEIVRCVRIDPEMKPMFNKALVKMEDDIEFPHVLLANNESFHNPNDYFEKAFILIKKEYDRYSSKFAAQGIKFSVPFDEKKPPSKPFQFLRYVESLTESLPDRVGSLVIVCDPEEVTDRDNFHRSVTFLSEETQSQYLKFLILDSRTEPLIEPDENDQRLSVQTFYLGPEEIEQRVTQDLETPEALQPIERRQYKGLVAGFAFGHRNYEKAEKLHRQCLAEAQQEAEPPEVAAAMYSLGNTLFEKKVYEEATSLYCQACDICIEHKLLALTPLVYTNLGISLHRQGEFEQAYASLKVARDIFKAQNMRPKEAYVVDCLATMYEQDGNNEKAEHAWLYALSLFDGITSPQFTDLRKIGREGILSKLEPLYKKMGRKEKSAKIEEEHNSHGDH